MKYLLAIFVTIFTINIGLNSSIANAHEELSGPVDTDNDGLLEIHSLEQLQNIRNDNSFKGCSYNSFKGFELEHDINLEGDANNPDRYNFSPIRGLSNIIFEGNGYILSNLWIDTKGTNEVGLFSELMFSTVRNVKFDNALIKNTDGNYTGIIAGYTDAVTIENVEVKQSRISGNYAIGGLIGSGDTVRIRYANVNNVTISGNKATGGFIGLGDEVKFFRTCIIHSNIYRMIESPLNGSSGYMVGATPIARSIKVTSGHSYIVRTAIFDRPEGDPENYRDLDKENGRSFLDKVDIPAACLSL